MVSSLSCHKTALVWQALQANSLRIEELLQVITWHWTTHRNLHRICQHSFFTVSICCPSKKIITVPQPGKTGGIVKKKNSSSSSLQMFCVITVYEQSWHFINKICLENLSMGSFSNSDTPQVSLGNLLVQFSTGSLAPKAIVWWSPVYISISAKPSE